MSSFAVMMSNFGPDTTTRTVYCMDCGREIIADNRTRVKRCSECRDAAQWLATDAELWLRCCGIGVTRTMVRKLRGER